MEHFQRYLNLNLPKPYSSFLWGARKTGKSTYLKQTFPNSFYVNLLKPNDFRRYVNNPHYLREELLAAPKGILNYPIILDEVQKVPQLLNEVHWMIENIKGIQFILCGSSIRKVKQSSSNLLRGRAWRTMFMPLCFPELKKLEWDKIMNRGLLPSHYLSSYAHKLLSSYVIDYLLLEAHIEASLRSSQGFSRFLDVLGFCQGELLNYSNISRNCGIDAKTIKTYFEILSDMHLGYFVYPFSKQVSRQIIKEVPKFYLMDTGLSHHLKKYKFTEFRGFDAGKAFEHYVLLELMAYKLLNNLDYNIHFWRTQDGIHEVDFVLNEGQIAIACKITLPITRRDLKSLLFFGSEHQAKLHAVTLESRKRLMTIDSQEVIIWPIEDFLNALWGGTFLR